MNEQDMILRRKIEKREKIDTILAYILIVILLGCIGVVLYLKFVREEEPVIPDEYVPNYITLNDISYSLNNSLLANRYLNDGATFGTSVSNDLLNISYVKEDINLDLDMTVTNGELEINIPLENADIVEDIYKEIVNIICVYYGNDAVSCRNTTNGIDEDSSIGGIRFVRNWNTNTVYIDTTKSIDINSEIVYKNVTRTSVDNTNYTLNLLDIEIRNISITSTDVNIRFSGTVERLTEDMTNISVIVRLYNNNGELLGENKQEFNDENPLVKVNTFEVAFILSDTLNSNDISDYSIEIVK